MRTPPTLLRMCVLLLLANFIAGCGYVSNVQNGFSIQTAASSVAVGGTVTLHATVMIDGAMQNVTSQTTWSVSDSSIATIENNVLQSKSVGTVVVKGALASLTPASGTSTASASLTITPLAPAITWPQPAAVPAGTALSSTQLNAMANVPGTFSYNPAVGTVLQAGTQTLTVNFAPADSKNYSSASASTTISVTGSTSPAPTLAAPVITWPQPGPVPAGTVLSAAQLDATANVPGTFTYNPAAGTVLQQGTQTLTANFTPSDSQEYSSASASTTINVTGSTIQAATLTAVRISGSSTTVQTGQSIQFSATAVYSDNSTKDVTGAAGWSSSNSAVAAVRSGTVSGVAAGTAQISASYNGVSSAPAAITVNAPEPTLTAVRISGSSTTVQTGQSIQFSATAVYSDNSTKDVTGAASWSSSNSAVAAVRSGTVTGVAAGTAQISASYNGVSSAPAAITVNAPEPTLTAVRVSGSSTTAQTGQSIQFSATAVYSDNSTKDVTGAASWSSSNSAVAAVRSGTVTGVAAGTVQISASYNGVSSAPAAITVNAPEPTLTAVRVSGTSTTVQTGQSIQFSATAVYSDNSTKDVTGAASWSSSNSAVAAVRSGTVSGVAAGTAQISASYNGVSSAPAAITVNAPEPTLIGLRISGASTTVQTGQSIQFSATAVYSDNSTKDVTGAASWSSSNSAVAAVRSGTVSGVAAGTAQISASYNGVSSAPAAITVNAPEPTLIGLRISGSSTTVQTGQSIQFSATAVYSDNSTKDVTGAANWSSSNSAVAAVRSGTVSGVAAGTAQISASYNGVSSAPAAITVNGPEPTLTAVRISGASTTVQTGQSIQFSATAVYSDNSTKDVTGAASWSSSNSAVAAVRSGTVSGVAAGTAQISASYNGVSSAPAAITVNAQEPTLTAVRISGSSTTVQTGQGIQFSATAVYSDNSTKDVTGAASWSSSNSAVAAVRSGTVSGVAAGTAQISASYNGMSSTPAAITVNAPEANLTAIQINGSSTVGAGASTQMKAIGTYSDQTTKDITSTASWASSQYSVATVQGGSVTGVNPGTASITATLSGVSAAATITVTSGYVVQIDPSMSQNEIQSKITGSQTGDTIAFAAGSYPLTYPTLGLPPGRTYLCSTSGTTVFSGSGGYALMTFYGSGLTIQNCTFNGGGLYLGGAVSNVHVEQNTFENINAPYGNWTSEIAVFMDTSAADSDISYNKFTNIGTNLLDQFADEVYSSGIFGYGLSNTTIQYNTFDTFNEGIHIFYNSLDGKNVHINNNRFVRGHRIAIEQQDGNAGGLEVAYNKVSEPLNAWALTFGLSIAASSNSGAGIIVHDNLINADTPVGADCRGSGCYYPYGIEAWGTGTQVYNNSIEGLWGNGVAIGAASNLSVINNTICGPNMAQNNTFVDFEYGSEPGTVIQGNNTSASMTCGAAN